MRFGTAWRMAVLASLALLLSGQLCMLTTCVPRLTQSRAAKHSCCRTTPAPAAPAQPLPATGAMPCEMMLLGADAPSLSPALSLAVPVVPMLAATVSLAPPAHVLTPVAEADTGPPLERLQPAPAGTRAPPQV